MGGNGHGGGKVVKGTEETVNVEEMARKEEDIRNEK